MDKIPQNSLVEAGGFEPPTPCLQSRCTTENAGSLNLTDRTEAHSGAQPKDAEETQGNGRPWAKGQLWAGRARRILNENAEELFESLNDLVETLDGHCDSDFWEVEVAQAKAALTKAIGGQP